ncbi:MAG: cyanophycinase [Pyrinomonadaceae bacterium]
MKFSISQVRLLPIVVLLFALPVIAQQRLLVVGGGERPPEAMKKFVEWSGGAKSQILAVTWASGVPDESFESLDKGFRAAGAASVAHAAVPPLDEAKRAKFVEQLSRATGVFFSGGDQNRIMDVLKDEELLRLLKAKYNAGAPFGGTSAGAAVMSDPMMTGEADLKILDGAKVGVRSGLGLLPNVIFDQHFLVRQRHNRLFGLMMVNPKMLGIGIDEDTAVLIEDNRKLTVAGQTQVMMIGPNGSKNSFSVYILRAGERFDLKRRKPGGKG